MTDKALESIVEQGDRGIHVQSSQNVAIQLDKKQKRLMTSFVFLGQGIEYKSWGSWILVRWKLEYGTLFLHREDVINL